MMNFILTDEYFKARGSVRTKRPTPLQTLSCARNDSACFHLLAETGTRCILDPGTSPALTYELGLPRFRIAVEAPFACTVRTEGYLEDENGIPCAEVLHNVPQTYEGGLFAPAHILVDVPADAKAGQYLITVRVFRAVGAFAEEKVFEGALTLNVCSYVLPSPQQWRCHLDLWQHNSNIARTFGTELWSDEHFAKMEQVIATLSDLGQRSVTVVAGDCPWRGWGCYLLKDHPATLFEYSMILIRREKDGSFSYDFSALRRYIELCFSYGIRGDITVYGLMGIWSHMPLFPGSAPEDYPEQVLIRYLDESDGCYHYLEKTEDILSYIRALFALFREMGVFHLVRIGADEPSDLNAYNKNVALLRSVAPDIQFKMALDKTSAIQTFSPDTDDIAASFPCSCENRALLHKVREENEKRRILFYVCNIPKNEPNTVLKSELYECTALAAIGYLFGFDGFLRWAYTCWTQDPLKDIRYNNTALPAGDVNFLYPAKSGGVLFSIRYFALRKMLQIYEMLHLLKDSGREEAIENALELILKNKDVSTYMKDDFCTNEGIFSEENKDYLAFYDALLRALTEGNG